MVNRLQARLDEEEFGDLEAPPQEESPAKVETAPPAPEKQVDVVESSKVAEPKSMAPAPVPVENEKKTVVGLKSSTISSASLDDKKAERAKRFGIETPSDLEEKKRQRAQRFGIPLVASGEKKDSSPRKKQKKGTQNPKLEAVELSKEEIEKRIKRAEKYNCGDPAALDKLKAMLRKHRFEASN